MDHLYWWRINAYRLANSEDLDEITHFIRVYTACYMYDKKGILRERNVILFWNYKLWPSIYIMDRSKINASNQEEESIKWIQG